MPRHPLDDLYDGKRLPLVLGHRGARALAPENTLPAFQAALEQGADGVELDVQLSADGRLVVIHDFTLDKTTDGSGPVRALRLADLQRLDAGAWFGGAFAGTRIPTLEAVLDLFRGRAALVNVELKTASLHADGLEPAVAEVIADLGMQRQVIVSSFNALALWRFRQAAGEQVPVGLLYDRLPLYAAAQRWLAPRVRPEALHPGRTVASAAHLAAIRRRGVRANVWTVNDPDEARRLAGLGVDAIITDEPPVVLAARDADQLA